MGKRFWLVAMAVSFLLNGVVIAGVVVVWPELRPVAVRYAKPVLRPPHADYAESLREIVAYVRAQELATDRERADFVRSFVFDNSVHQIDADHDRYAFDTSTVLTMLWRAHRGEGPPPHLSCGPRSLAMQDVLDELGISSRLTMVFSDDHPYVFSHTFLGVLDRASGRWEIQDPDFDVYFENVHTGLRASTAEIVFGDPENFLPHSPRESGWEATKTLSLRTTFEAMMLVTHFDGRGKSVVLVNQDRFDPDRRYPREGGISFREWADRHFARPAFVTNQTIAAR